MLNAKSPPPCLAEGRLAPSYCKKAAQARKGNKYILAIYKHIPSPWGRAREGSKAGQALPRREGNCCAKYLIGN
tara:strand:+ start:1186 stop:1407 length:222 start_codon:yes stop_codon:yes gene_type:complete